MLLFIYVVYALEKNRQSKANKNSVWGGMDFNIKVGQAFGLLIFGKLLLETAALLLLETLR